MELLLPAAGHRAQGEKGSDVRSFDAGNGVWLCTRFIGFGVQVRIKCLDCVDDYEEDDDLYSALYYYQ